jgi:hypothetical protein
MLAEGTAIVVSILLAFGVQAWWEEQREARELEGMLALLSSEVARNIEVLEVALDAHRELSAAIELSRQTGSWKGLPNNPFFPVAVFNPDDGAFEALIASGLIGQIEDLELRVLISSLPGLIADLAEKESRAVARRELARNRLAALGVRIPDGSALPDDDGYWSDPELLNLLQMRGVEEGNVIEAGETLLEHLDRIRARLQS